VIDENGRDLTPVVTVPFIPNTPAPVPPELAATFASSDDVEDDDS
jgi:hypothetical protein